MILIFQSQRLLFGSEVSHPVTVTSVADTNRCPVAKVTPNVMPTVPNHCKMVVSQMSCYVHLHLLGLVGNLGRETGQRHTREREPEINNN